MVYFIPDGAKRRIYPNDKRKMAVLSSTGKQPARETPGFIILKWGKTYRDEQITSYKRDVRAGYFTKAELIYAMPPRFQAWLEDKLKTVPYDENSEAAPMLMAAYRGGR